MKKLLLLASIFLSVYSVSYAQSEDLAGVFYYSKITKGFDYSLTLQLRENGVYFYHEFPDDTFYSSSGRWAVEGDTLFLKQTDENYITELPPTEDSIFTVRPIYPFLMMPVLTQITTFNEQGDSLAVYYNFDSLVRIPAKEVFRMRSSSIFQGEDVNIYVKELSSNNFIIEASANTFDTPWEMKYYIKNKNKLKGEGKFVLKRKDDHFKK